MKPTLVKVWEVEFGFDPIMTGVKVCAKKYQEAVKVAREITGSDEIVSQVKLLLEVWL